MLWPLSLGQIGSTFLLSAIGYLDLVQRQAPAPAFVLFSCAAIISLSGPLGYVRGLQGFVRQGKLFFLLSSLLSLTIATLYYGPLSAVTFFFIWPIVVASIMFRARAGFFVAVLSSVLLVLLYAVENTEFIHALRPATPTALSIKLTTIILAYFTLSYLIWVLARRLYDSTQRQREQARKLEAANKYLMEANQLKSDFIGTVSHELRTPLNCAMGYTELLMNGVYGALSEEQIQKLRVVNESNEKLLAHINAMLSLSDIHTGQLTLHPELINVEKLLADSVAAAETSARLKGLTLRLHTDGSLPPLYADPRQLKLVLSNLLSNAIKFTHEGTIEVRSQRLHKNHDFQRVPPQRRPVDGEWIGLKVIDTGVGIAPEMQALIFDEFRQVDGSTTRRYGGLGLGLALSKRLIELHGGYIWVESKVKHGSTFTVALPAAGSKQERGLNGPEAQLDLDRGRRRR